MTTSDQIYLATGGLPPAEVARRIAAALRLETHTDDVGVQVLRQEAPGEPVFGGEIDVNGNYAFRPEDHTPSDDSVSDGFDIEWDIGSSARDEEAIHAAAREFFDLVAARLPWPALLVSHNYQRLVAASRPGEGVVELPPGTSPDAPDRAVWEPYALPR
jgi:hypothetical protein